MASVGARLRSRMAASGTQRSYDQDFGASAKASPPTPAPATKTRSKPPAKLPRGTSLSEKDQRDVHTAFVLLDRDGDGELSVDDVTGGLQELGCSVPRSSVQTFIGDVTEGGSLMKESDMLGWVEGKGSTATAVVKLAFTALDRDNDGYITQDDLKFGMTVTHEKMSPSMLSLMFDEADSDNDGKIDIKDFLQALGEL